MSFKANIEVPILKESSLILNAVFRNKEVYLKHEKEKFQNLKLQIMQSSVWLATHRSHTIDKKRNIKGIPETDEYFIDFMNPNFFISV
jgi:hypothetical protein